MLSACATPDVLKRLPAKGEIEFDKSNPQMRTFAKTSNLFNNSRKSGFGMRSVYTFITRKKDTISKNNQQYKVQRPNKGNRLLGPAL